MVKAHTPGPVNDAPTASSSPWPRRVRIGLAALLVPFAAFLVLGPDPFGAEFRARAAAGEHLRPRDFAGAYLWWMTLASSLAVIGLLATYRLWARPGRPAEDAAFAPAAGPGRLFHVGVALAMLGMVVSALPRLDDALWTDEKYMVVRSIAGQYEVDDQGQIEFEAVSWGNTFFYYVKPNNHVPYSVAARLCWDLWRVITQPEDRRASETVVRAPALVAAVLGIAALAWLLLRLGFPAAGVLAAWILALHPWYLRYASEVRGYAFMLALVPLVVVAALRVLERGSWPRHALYGLAQVLLLWTYPGTLFVLVVINAAVAFRLVQTRKGDLGEGAPPLLRFFMTEFFAGLVWLQLNLVNMMQFLEYAKSWTSPITIRFLRETSLLMLLGTPEEPYREGFISMAALEQTLPLALPVLIWVSALAFAVGVGCLLVRGAAARLALTVLVLPGPLTVLFAAVRGDHLYEWYLIHALPGVIACIALGIAAATRLVPAGRARQGATAVVLVAFVSLYAVVSHPMRDALRTRDIQPTFAFLEAFGWPPDRDPRAPRPALTGAVYGTMDYYDPAMRDVRTPDALFALMREADRTAMPLYVSFNRPLLARKRAPETIAWLERPDLFVPVGEFDGVFHKYRRSVYRYRKGSVDEVVAPPEEPPAG